VETKGKKWEYLFGRTKGDNSFKEWGPERATEGVTWNGLALSGAAVDLTDTSWFARDANTEKGDIGPKDDGMQSCCGTGVAKKGGIQLSDLTLKQEGMYTVPLVK